MTGGTSEKFTSAFDPVDGRLSSVTRATLVGANQTNTSRESFDYDRLGRLNFERSQDLSGQSPAITQRYSFDDAGNITQRREYRDAPTATTETLHRTVDYAFDELGRQSSLKETLASGSLALAAKFEYNKRNQLTSVKRYGDSAMTDLRMVSTHIYDPAARQTSISHVDSTTSNVFSSFTYSFDAGGRITQVNSLLDGITTYTYDLASQLTSETTGGVTKPYAWDAAGNPAGAGVVVGPGNRLLNDGEFAFAYDAEGRRTQRVNIATGEKITYGYDAAGRLINEKQFASTSSTNPLFSLDIAYDAVGRRKTQTENTYTGSQITNTAVDHFHYNGWNVSSVTNGVSGSYLDYVHGVGTDSMLAETKMGRRFLREQPPSHFLSSFPEETWVESVAPRCNLEMTLRPRGRPRKTPIPSEVA